MEPETKMVVLQLDATCGKCGGQLKKGTTVRWIRVPGKGSSVQCSGDCTKPV